MLPERIPTRPLESSNRIAAKVDSSAALSPFLRNEILSACVSIEMGGVPAFRLFEGFNGNRIDVERPCRAPSIQLIFHPNKRL